MVCTVGTNQNLQYLPTVPASTNKVRKRKYTTRLIIVGCNADIMDSGSNLVADDRLVFALDPQTVYQYDLRTARATMRPRGHKVLSVLPTLKSNERLHAPLRARLRPLLAESTSGQHNETRPVSLKHCSTRVETKLPIHESRQLLSLIHI